MNLPPIPYLGASPLTGKMRRLASRLRRKVTPRRHQLLFAFTGGSGARRDAGRGLYRDERVFRESVDACGRVVEKLFGLPAAALFRGDATPHASPATARRDELLRLGLSQFGLFDLWASAGVKPSGLLGVGLGEVAAAYASRSLSREDATTVLCSLVTNLARDVSTETHFVLDADAETARRLCRNAPARLDLLGTTSPGVWVLTSSASEAGTNRAFLARRAAVRAELTTEPGEHRPRLPLRLTSLDEDLRGITTRPAGLKVYSAAAGGCVAEETPLDAHFWGWVLRGPFDFDGALSAAFADGFDLVVHVGAAAAAADWMRETARARGRAAHFVESSRGGEPEGEAWARALKEVRSRRLAEVQRRPPRPPSTAETLDLSAPEVALDPFPHYEELRRTGSVHFLPRHGFWLVLGFDDAHAALMRPNLFSNRVPEWLAVDQTLLGADPPEHTAARRILGQLFSAQSLEAQAAFAGAAAERLLRPLAEGRACDVLPEFAAPLSEEVAAHLIGFDRETVAAIRAAQEAGQDLGQVLDSIDSIIAGAAERLPIYKQLLRDGEGKLAEAEARSLIRLLWVAGTTTTRRAVASSVLMLLRHEPVRLRVAADPRLLPAFVEESLRLHPPEHMLSRRTTAPAELSGVKLPAGAAVMLCVAAANLDPARFDHPAALLPERAPNRHLSFGGGIHRCLGAAVARAEAVAALRVLLRLAPRFRPVQPLGTLRFAGFVNDTERLVIEC